eukprot:Skav221752  [mRNA]  locus=scaffold2018:95221:95688:+ [translate_table: standard]
MDALDAREALCLKAGYALFRLDGKLDEASRARQIANFNACAGRRAFLLSKEAGATGINLTSASDMINFEPAWNPMIDLQAAARIFRPGQEKRCKLTRLFAAGTWEEFILLSQTKKQHLGMFAHGLNAILRHSSLWMWKRLQRGFTGAEKKMALEL